MATFAEAAGVPAPARCDGVSLMPALTGQGTQRTPRVYVEYFHNARTPKFMEFEPAHRNRIRQQMQALVIGDHVGVRYDIKKASDDFEIYDAVKDPKQAHDLAKGSGMAELQRQFKETALRVRRPDEGAKRPYDEEPVPSVAVAAGGMRPGLDWRAYAGSFPWVPQFEGMTASGEGRAEALKLDVAKGAAGLRFDGYIEVPADGKYTFYLSSDGGAEMRLHEATVIDADFGYAGGREVLAEIVLKAGRHPFHLAYARRAGAAGAAALQLSWSGPGFEKRVVPAAAYSSEAAAAAR
jgi:hypothetical protein